MSSTYTVLFVLHIVAVTGAFGPVAVYAVFIRRAQEAGGEVGKSLLETAEAINKRAVLPALLATILLGFALIGVSDAYAFEQAWVSASMTIALLLVALNYFLIGPSLSKLAASMNNGTETDASALKTLRLATAVYQIGFIVIVWLMYSKPMG